MALPIAESGAGSLAPAYVVLGAIAVASALCLWRGRTEARKRWWDIGTALLTGLILTGGFAYLQTRTESNQKAQEKRDDQREKAQEKRDDQRQKAAEKLAAANAKLLADRQALGVQRDLRRADLVGRDLHEFDLSGKDLRRADLSHAHLAGARLRTAELYLARFDDAELPNADLRGARLYRASLQGANLQGARMRNAHLEGAVLGPSADRPLVNLREADLVNAHLRHTCLAHADLHGAQLGGADLSDAILTGADLRGAQLIVDGVPANLRGAWIHGVKVDPAQRAFLRGAHRAVPRSADASGHGPPPGAVRDRIVEVSDGDTLRLARRGWVRLVGIDAPDTSAPAGKPARDYLEALRKRGGSVRYALGTPGREHMEHGGLGRWRAYLWEPGGHSLSAALLEQGYAVRQRLYERASEVRELDDAQTRAQAAGLQVWSSCPPQ